MQTWLHLLYKIPRNPTARRVYIWRKLKKLGAVLLNDSVWCLPANPRTLEQFQWIVVEIQETGGEASLWESRLLLGWDNEKLVQMFEEQVDSDYAEIMNELQHENLDLSELSKRYQQVKTRDYFNSELGNRVKGAIIEARGGAQS